jgi:hypothetical protein
MSQGKNSPNGKNTPTACNQYQSFVERTLSEGNQCFNNNFTNRIFTTTTDAESHRKIAHCESFTAEFNFLKDACHEERFLVREAAKDNSQSK